MNAPRRVVLVVDDEPITRDVVAAMLELEDVEVHTAANGAEAVERARDLHPHLVLLDVRMPDMDGLEACRRLRALDDPPRVAMLTGTTDAASREAAAAAGAEAYLAKPFSARDVFRLVEGETVP
jgi:CheY-like chemotaxis protein